MLWVEIKIPRSYHTRFQNIVAVVPLHASFGGGRYLFRVLYISSNNIQMRTSHLIDHLMIILRFGWSNLFEERAYLITDLIKQFACWEHWVFVQWHSTLWSSTAISKYCQRAQLLGTSYCVDVLVWRSLNHITYDCRLFEANPTAVSVPNSTNKVPTNLRSPIT